MSFYERVDGRKVILGFLLGFGGYWTKQFWNSPSEPQTVLLYFSIGLVMCCFVALGSDIARQNLAYRASAVLGAAFNAGILSIMISMPIMQNY